MQVPSFLAALALSLYPCVLCAQSTNASLTGRVTDPSKGAIAEAGVAAINTGTNFRYDASTNSSGEYFLTLPPGYYRIEVEKSGFKKLIRPAGRFIHRPIIVTEGSKARFSEPSVPRSFNQLPKDSACRGSGHPTSMRSITEVAA